MPFETEELWGELYTIDKRLIHADWPQLSFNDFGNSEVTSELEWVISMIENIRSVRSQLRVPPKVITPLSIISLSNSKVAILEKYQNTIMKLARTNTPVFQQNPESESVTITVDGGEISLPLGEVIDLSLEMKRLFESKESLEKEISKLKARLGNEGFVAKAPPEVVEETRENLQNLETKIQSIIDAVDRIHV